MDSVLERLRESRKRGESKAMTDGRAAGEAWVKEQAEVAEIERLEQYFEVFDTVDGWTLFDSQDAYTASEHLVFRIQPENEGDRRAASDFWEMVLGHEQAEQAESPAFLEGFVVGALELWDTLNGQV